MATITNITKVVNRMPIGDREYVLVSFDIVGLNDKERSYGICDHMYGTIDPEDIDENGIFKRVLCLADLSATDAPDTAVECRKAMMEAEKLIEEYKARKGA